MREGWPGNRQDILTEVREFWDVREDLTTMNGMIFKGEQVLIPSAIHSDMLRRINEGHLGIKKCKRWARDVIYWLRMSAEIADLISRCSICLTHRNWQKKESLKSHDIPSIPWQKVVSNIFTINGKNYLLVVDYYSRFVELALLNDTRGSTVVTHFKSIFSFHGIPQTLITDNGPNYVISEFKQFTASWEIGHITSSPRYPQSNGLAERMVQTEKSHQQSQRCKPILGPAQLESGTTEKPPISSRTPDGQKTQNETAYSQQTVGPRNNSPLL
ncbi:Pol polyprotein [Plakobranchus ocellatus]|uniref:Pol polyprotein n=1 Tax=Plakobranchus ocellatus TaxID=259542 RepID=A0AAV3Z1L8_9GAST|nr:Pol polyprotein [Plakobranchus ocellatus]